MITRIKAIRNFILLLLVLIVNNCSKIEVECIPKLYDCKLRLLDNDGNSLIGLENIYKSDSIKLIVNAMQLRTYIDISGIKISYIGLDSLNNFDYYLYLSSTDTDTLNFIVSKKPGDCFYSYNIDTLRYNNKIIEPETGSDNLNPIFDVLK